MSRTVFCCIPRGFQNKQFRHELIFLDQVECRRHHQGLTVSASLDLKTQAR